MYMCFGYKHDEGVIWLFTLSFNSGLLSRGTDISLHVDIFPVKNLNIH